MKKTQSLKIVAGKPHTIEETSTGWQTLNPKVKSLVRPGGVSLRELHHISH